MKVLIVNTAVDSEVGYDGAEFNSVCCKYSQSLEFFFTMWIMVSIINALYSPHVKSNATSKSNVEPKWNFRLFQSQIRQSQI